jgi:isopentenyl diphosphate isomerase/L-lactate dehydrogenase-like FMN-dependent dehydrogenase
VTNVATSSLPAIPEAPLTVEEYRALAAQLLAADVFDYIEGGAGAEITVAANRLDLDKLSLAPLCLRDVSEPMLATKILGVPMSCPIGFSPTAFHRLAHADGEVATARAARQLDIPMVVSSMSSVALEAVAERSGHQNLWLQVYFFRDRELTSRLVLRAERAGFKAIVVTLGCPVPGKRERNLRNRFRLPGNVSAANFGAGTEINFNNPIHSIAGVELDASVTWDDVAWLRGLTTLPVVGKGLLNPGDVPPAIECGMSAILVSNHGGRQLDTSVSTIRALREIVERVSGRLPVLVDSGFRSGTDILKALAVGADAVFLGRPVLWALAAGGDPAVADMVRLLRDELRLAMQLAGCGSIEELRRDGQLLVRW